MNIRCIFLSQINQEEEFLKNAPFIYLFIFSLIVSVTKYSTPPLNTFIFLMHGILVPLFTPIPHIL